MLTRRTLLQRTLGAAAIVAGAATPLRALERLARRATTYERDALGAAIRAAAWVRRSRIVSEGGVVWPADPRDPATVGTTLYTGTPGVVLLYLELYHATGDRVFLDEAAAGADALAAGIPAAIDDPKTGVGLYEGLAGQAYTLALAHQTTGRAAYRDAAARVVAAMQRRATPEPGTTDGVAWSDVNDVIAGAAGTGLFLLWWAQAFNDPAAVALAARAGTALLARGITPPDAPNDGSTAPNASSAELLWKVNATYPRVLPNFSHGGAGVGYFLASLYQTTGRPEYLRGATAAARYLQRIARRDGGTCLVRHDDGAGTDLYYLSWCHGPVGTARLFARLEDVTRDREYEKWVVRCARGVATSGIPEQRTPGFWNNVSQCCGDTGVGQFFVDRYRRTGSIADLAFAERVRVDLMRRATDDGAGLRWVQAENRTQPENLIAQTGFMQGAAGMGVWLAQLDGATRRRAPAVVLPDSPFT